MTMFEFDHEEIGKMLVIGDIDRVLNSLSQRELETVKNLLREKHHCQLKDFYEHHDVLYRVLKELYSIAYVKIIESLS